MGEVIKICFPEGGLKVTFGESISSVDKRFNGLRQFLSWREREQAKKAPLSRLSTCLYVFPCTNYRTAEGPSIEYPTDRVSRDWLRQGGIEGNLASGVLRQAQCDI